MRMKLTDCKKADLLWIIKRMCQYDLSDRNLHLALNELEYEKERDRLDLAQQLAKKRQDAIQRYIEIMQPYVDKPILSIPKDIMEKAIAALEEAKAADRQWRKLMGIKA